MSLLFKQKSSVCHLLLIIVIYLHSSVDKTFDNVFVFLVFKIQKLRLGSTNSQKDGIESPVFND